MSTIQTSQLSLFILAFSLWFGGHAHSDDKPTFKDAPLTVNELADLLGIKKTGFRVQFPEPRYARLVAEIQVKGKVRQEFATLKQATKEFTIATFVQSQSHSSSFRRMCFEITVEVGESERRFINDFAGADIEQSSMIRHAETVTYSYKFKTYPGTPSVKPTELGSVKIHLETSLTPFAPAPKK